MGRIAVKSSTSRAEKGRAVKRGSALGPMCDEEKERSFRASGASGAINGCRGFLASREKTVGSQALIGRFETACIP